MKTDKHSHCLACWVLAWGTCGAARNTVSFLFFDCCCWQLKQGQLSLEVQPLGTLAKFLECCFRTIFKCLLSWPGQPVGQLLQLESFLPELCQAAPAEPSPSCSECLLICQAAPGHPCCGCSPCVPEPLCSPWAVLSAKGARCGCRDPVLWCSTLGMCLSVLPWGFNCSSSSVCYVPLWCISATVVVVLLFSCWFWCFWFLCQH